MSLKYRLRSFLGLDTITENQIENRNTLATLTESQKALHEARVSLDERLAWIGAALLAASYDRGENANTAEKTHSGMSNEISNLRQTVLDARHVLGLVHSHLIGDSVTGPFRTPPSRA